MTTEFAQTHIEDPENEVSVVTEVPEKASYHSLLKVFQTVFSGADVERQERITPVYANRILTLHPLMTFKTLPIFHEKYFDKIEVIHDLLNMEAEAAGDGLKADSAEEDMELNYSHYLNLLLQWQLALQQWDMDWDVADEHAAEEMAANAEIYKFLFSQTGIVQFFDGVGFEFDEADRDAITAALEEAREGK